MTEPSRSASECEPRETLTTRSHGDPHHLEIGAVQAPAMRRISWLLMATVLASSGCASRYRVEGQAPAYAAVSKIKVRVNKTENRVLRLEVEHLAPPQRISPRYTNYAVWIAVPGVGLTKAGLLDYNDRRRRGTLEATTPHSNFEVLLTLESDRSATQPSSNVIVRKVVGRA